MSPLGQPSGHQGGLWGGQLQCPLWQSVTVITFVVLYMISHSGHLTITVLVSCMIHSYSQPLWSFLWSLWWSVVVSTLLISHSDYCHGHFWRTVLIFAFCGQLCFWCVVRLIWWRHFLFWGFLFQDDCISSVKLTKTNQHTRNFGLRSPTKDCCCLSHLTLLIHQRFPLLSTD